MLDRLLVKDLALIEKSVVEFSGGLNVLTGETGAGKSILLGSILLGHNCIHIFYSFDNLSTSSYQVQILFCNLSQ